MSTAGSEPVLLFDDTCGMCAASVQFVLRHERDHRTLRFAPLRGTLGVAVRTRHAELDAVDSVMWIESADDLKIPQIRSSAVIRVLRYLGGPWHVLASMLWIVPRPVRDWGYNVVAKHRHSLTRAGAACILPTAEERARFLE